MLKKVILAVAGMTLAAPSVVFGASCNAGPIASTTAPTPAAVAAPPPASTAVVAPAQAASTLPGSLAAMTRLGVFQITKQFKTPVKGVTGYLLNQHGRYSVVYGIDGYVLAGALLSPTGANLTAAYNHQYAPKPAYAGIIKALRKDGNLISMGSPTAKQVLYVFEDPNCIFCHKLSVALTPYLKAGKVRIEIAPVAFVHPDSMGKSTAILAAKDPGAAWAENEDAAKYNTHTEEGGYAVQNPPDPKLVAVVRRNMRLMGKAGFGGTPGILYRGADGKWAGAAGFPGVAWLVRQFGKP